VGDEVAVAVAVGVAVGVSVGVGDGVAVGVGVGVSVGVGVGVSVGVSVGVGDGVNVAVATSPMLTRPFSVTTAITAPAGLVMTISVGIKVEDAPVTPIALKVTLARVAEPSAPDILIRVTRTEEGV